MKSRVKEILNERGIKIDEFAMSYQKSAGCTGVEAARWALLAVEGAELPLGVAVRIASVLGEPLRDVFGLDE